MRAAILARVSSDEQHVETQLKSMREQAARDGAQVVAEYVDDGVSGASGNMGRRLGLQRMLTELRGGVTWTVLYVWDMDRFLRSDEPEEQAAIIGPLKRAGVDLRTRNGLQPSLSTTWGRLAVMLQLEASADWLRKHKDRIVEGKARAIAEGRKPAGPTPFGYSYDRATGVWSISGESGPIVREIFARVAAGESCEELARDFTRRGVKRCRSSTWARHRVWALATARTYLGEWVADKAKGSTIAVPQIIDAELWERVQEQLQRWGGGRLLRGQKRPRDRVYLLEGLAVCDVCGARIGINHSQDWSHTTKRTYYICQRRRAPGLDDRRCALRMQQTQAVDEAVWEEVARTLSTPDRLENAMAATRAAAGGGARDWEADAKGYEAQLRRLQANEAVVLEQFETGMVSAEGFAKANRRRGDQRRMLEESLRRAREAALEGRGEERRAGAVLANLVTLRARLTEATTPAARREVMLRFVPVGSVRLGDEAIDLILDPADAEPVVPMSAAGSSYERSDNRPIPLRVVAPGRSK